MRLFSASKNLPLPDVGVGYQSTVFTNSKAFIVRNKRLGLKDVYINVLTFWKLWAELKVWNNLKAKVIYGEFSLRFFDSLNFHHLNRTNDFCHQKSVNLVFAHSINFFSRETKSFHKTWLTDFFCLAQKIGLDLDFCSTSSKLIFATVSMTQSQGKFIKTRKWNDYI